MSGTGVGGVPGADVAPTGITVPQNQLMRGSNKPPRFEGTYELYRAELELYLGERQSWDVVTGMETRHASDQALQTQFDDRDRFARATILRGLRGCQNDDATKVCSMATAAEMWASLVADKTQRDFSYTVLLRRQLYQHSHHRGESMLEYLKKMAGLRQQLQNMGTEHFITDNEMARILLMGVAIIHRELIEQFDLPTRQGNPPTLQQVMNALRSRDERDKMVEEATSTIDGGTRAVVMNVSTSSKYPSSKRGSKSAKKIKCFHCGKNGHFRRDCWHFKKKLMKAHENQDKFNARKKNKRHQVNYGEEAAQTSVNWIRGYFDHGTCDSDSDGESSPKVAMVMKKMSPGDSRTWILDCGSTTHVCMERDRFTNLKKSKAHFTVWTGQKTKGSMSGSVLVRAINPHTKEMIQVQLDDVEYAPRGTTNLISLGRMEKKKWVLSFSPPTTTPMRIWLDRGSDRLEFIKTGDHYWLQSSETLVVDDGLSMLTLNADASPLMRWHERLGHLNVSTIKYMAVNNVVSGMEIPEELFTQRFTCVSCISAKHKRMSYKASAAEKRTKVKYERIMSDVCDMGKHLPGVKDYRYFQLIQDEGSRFKWCYLLKRKSESNGSIIRLVTDLLAHGHYNQRFTSDGGGDFVNTELKAFLTSKGIRFVPTHPYTPEENALVEKLNGVLVNKMRAAMHAADLPTLMRPEVLQYIVDIDNMSATRALKKEINSKNY